MQLANHLVTPIYACFSITNPTDPNVAYTSESLHRAKKACLPHIDTPVFHAILTRVSFMKVGPYFNPSETYPYYTLPMCKPDKIETVTSLGGKLDGDKLANSLYNIQFRGIVLNVCERGGCGQYGCCAWGIRGLLCTRRRILGIHLLYARQE